MDSNHDKVIQNHLCYRYTTRQWKFPIFKRLVRLFPMRSPKIPAHLTVRKISEDGVGGKPFSGLSEPAGSLCTVRGFDEEPDATARGKFHADRHFPRIERPHQVFEDAIGGLFSEQAR